MYTVRISPFASVLAYQSAVLKLFSGFLITERGGYGKVATLLTTALESITKFATGPPLSLRDAMWDDSTTERDNAVILTNSTPEA